MGLPLGGSPRIKNFCDPVSVRCRKRLSRWKANYLFCGKNHLNKSHPFKLTHILSILIQDSLRYHSRDRKITSSFPLEGTRSFKTHLINWKTLSKEKENGDLALGGIANRNIALLDKWLWRFPLEISTFGALFGVISAMPPAVGTPVKYLIHHIVAPGKVSQVLPKFLPFTKLSLGCGNLIRFWDDPWGILYLFGPDFLVL